jgi:hypothetical protein
MRKLKLARASPIERLDFAGFADDGRHHYRALDAGGAATSG